MTSFLTALSKFLSKYAKRNLPFFKALKGGKSFQWTVEYKKVFQEYLKEIHLLTRLEIKEKLCLYLGISHHAMSIVLVRQGEQANRQIYYVSKVLQGEES